MERNIDRRNVLRGLGAAGLVGLAGCAGDDNGDDGNGDMDGGDMDEAFEAQIGIMMPLTGDLGPLGETIRDGALLAADQISDADVSVTVDTQVEDTQTDPQAGISGANALVNAGYQAVVGPAASNVNLQVTDQVFIPNSIVGMSPSSTAPEVTDLDDDGFIFRTAPSDVLQGPAMADLAVDRFDASTAGTLFLNDDYGQSLEDLFVGAFEDRDGQVENRVSFEPEQPSYSSQWSEALNDNPDVVMIVGFPQSGIQIFRDFYSDFADDHDVDIIVPDGLIDPGLPGEVDNPMNEVIGTAPGSAGPGQEFFTDAYEDAYDASPGVFNSHAYDAMAVLVLASAAAGETTGPAIRDSIRDVANPGGTEVGPADLPEAAEMALNGEEINYQGASTTVEFDENGDTEGAAYDVRDFQDGELTTIDTITF
ncbi:MAG: ABC transporter substrate-binding protein [Natronomonas sp.]